MDVDTLPRQLRDCLKNKLKLAIVNNISALKQQQVDYDKLCMTSELPMVQKAYKHKQQKNRVLIAMYIALRDDQVQRAKRYHRQLNIIDTYELESMIGKETVCAVINGRAETGKEGEIHLKFSRAMVHDYKIRNVMLDLYK